MASHKRQTRSKKHSVNFGEFGKGEEAMRVQARMDAIRAGRTLGPTDSTPKQTQPLAERTGRYTIVRPLFHPEDSIQDLVLSKIAEGLRVRELGQHVRLRKPGSLHAVIFSPITARQSVDPMTPVAENIYDTLEAAIALVNHYAPRLETKAIGGPTLSRASDGLRRFGVPYGAEAMMSDRKRVASNIGKLAGRNSILLGPDPRPMVVFGEMDELTPMPIVNLLYSESEPYFAKNAPLTFGPLQIMNALPELPGNPQ